MNNDPHHNEGRAFRWTIGLLCVVGSLLGFAGLYFVDIPESNDKAMMFALGIVFGWGSMVVSSEYGATAVGRKVAEASVRSLERQTLANESAPSGTTEDPLKTEVVNTEERPANVTEARPSGD